MDASNNFCARQRQLWGLSSFFFFLKKLSCKICKPVLDPCGWNHTSRQCHLLFKCSRWCVENGIQLLSKEACFFSPSPSLSLGVEVGVGAFRNNKDWSVSAPRDPDHRSSWGYLKPRKRVCLNPHVLLIGLDYSFCDSRPCCLIGMQKVRSFINSPPKTNVLQEGRNKLFPRTWWLELVFISVVILLRTLWSCPELTGAWEHLFQVCREPIAPSPASPRLAIVFSLLSGSFGGLILPPWGKRHLCSESLDNTIYLISLWRCGIDLQSCLSPAARLCSTQAGNHSCCSITAWAPGPTQRSALTNLLVDDLRLF